MPGPKRCRVSTEEAEIVAGDVVTVLVGPLSTPFYVHKSLLRASSQYRESELILQQCEESSNLTLNLPAYEPRVFAIYTHWLYFKTLAVSSSSGSHDEEQKDLAMAYVFGDQICNRGFQNVIIDTIIEGFSLPDENGRCYLPSHFMISHLYEHTNPEDQVRRVLVDIYAYGCAIHYIRIFLEEEDLPTEFLHDLIVKLLTLQPLHWAQDNHDYHHNEGTDTETELGEAFSNLCRT